MRAYLTWVISKLNSKTVPVIPSLLFPLSFTFPGAPYRIFLLFLPCHFHFVVIEQQFFLTKTNGGSVPIPDMQGVGKCLLQIIFVAYVPDYQEHNNIFIKKSSINIGNIYLNIVAASRANTDDVLS